MTNQNDTELVNMIARIYVNGYMCGNREWVKEKLGELVGIYGMDKVRYAMPDADDEFSTWYYQNEVADTRVDDPELHGMLARIEQWDTEHESQKQFYSMTNSIACLAQDKLDKLESATGMNRSTVDNKAYWHKRAGDAILYMESVHDQYTLGLLPKEFVRKYMQKVYQSCTARLKRVRWLKKGDGKGKSSVIGYIPGVGYSVTDMRALCNTALSILEDMGYRIPGNWWKRDSKGKIVSYEFSADNARQDRTGDDWTREIETNFYQQF